MDNSPNLIPITETDGIVRADKFLAERYPAYSRAALQKLFELGLVKRANQPLKSGDKLRPGQVLSVDISPLLASPEVIDLPIIYEDDDVVVIDKPAGVISHARGKYWQEASVASFLRHHSAKAPKPKLQSNQAISYVMGCQPEVADELRRLGADVQPAGGSYCVTFSTDNLTNVQAAINHYLMPGYWNEIITETGLYFTFKDAEGEELSLQASAGNYAKILGLCRKYAKTDFADLESMLRGNQFYAASPLLSSSLLVLAAGGMSHRAGIVHRLDRATSGLMICAKNDQALKFLQRQFHDRLVSKTYLAVTEKPPKHHSATIDAPIGRDPKDPKKFRVDAQGKPAITDYQQLKTKPHRTMLELKPQTGRTHQLRVHLAYIGCPIIGDILYGGKAHERLLLHAAKLQITLPSGLTKQFISPLPEHFYD